MAKKKQAKLTFLDIFTGIVLFLLVLIGGLMTFFAIMSPIGK